MKTYPWQIISLTNDIGNHRKQGLQIDNIRTTSYMSQLKTKKKHRNLAYGDVDIGLVESPFQHTCL
jgi:hypothetical protein